jgi:phenylacetate-coenzyme A ligase PaaK-like adenylate-forming protein
MAREIYSRDWDRMTIKEQKEYQDSKLCYFIRTQLYPYSQFYREMFDENKVEPGDIRKVDDLRRLPFTYKADIAPSAEEPSRFRKFVLQPEEKMIEEFMPRLQFARMKVDKRLKGEEYVKRSLWRKYGPVHIQFTTGRTGQPTPVLYAADDVERMAEAGRRILELAGFGKELRYDDAVLVNAMPFAPHLAFWMVAKGLDKAGVLALHSGGGRVVGTERIVSAVENMKATGIVGMPGYVYHVLRTAEEQGRDFSSVRLVLVSGERVTKGMKEKMGKFLGSMGANNFFVLGALGFTEARKSYSECVPGGDTGYHLFPDMDYIELVDPESGEPVGEGEDGELVYTCLEGQGTAVLRFRTGDFVKGGIVYEPCPSCGRTVPRLGSDISRSGTIKGFSLTKIKGALVDQCAYFSVLTDHPKVEEWQVEIRKAGDDPYEIDVVDVYVAPQKGADLESLRSQLEQELQTATEVKPNVIEFLPLDELVKRLKTENEMKEVRFVDRRPET